MLGEIDTQLGPFHAGNLFLVGVRRTLAGMPNNFLWYFVCLYVRHFLLIYIYIYSFGGSPQDSLTTLVKNVNYGFVHFNDEIKTF